jgi:hypothetical protein
MVAQGGVEGGTLGESTSIQGSPEQGDGKPASRLQSHSERKIAALYHKSKLL